jgi:hypothetical protein
MPKKKIALDANLLVLLTVGLAEPKLIAAHKRLRDYDLDDFEMLKSLISVSDGVVVTPNTLSEASNLLRQIGEPARSQIAASFRRLIGATSEVYVRSAVASSRPEFLWLGLSDSAILEVSREDIVVLSVDANLCVAAVRAGYEAVNFNHERDRAYG